MLNYCVTIARQGPLALDELTSNSIHIATSCDSLQTFFHLFNQHLGDSIFQALCFALGVRLFPWSLSSRRIWTSTRKSTQIWEHMKEGGLIQSSRNASLRSRERGEGSSFQAPASPRPWGQSHMYGLVIAMCVPVHSWWALTNLQELLVLCGFVGYNRCPFTPMASVGQWSNSGTLVVATLFIPQGFNYFKWNPFLKPDQEPL